MFDFYQKRKLRSLVNSRYTQGVLLLLVFLVGWSAFVRFQIAEEMSDRRELAAQEAALLRTQKDALQEQVDYLSNERGIEAEMRRQFDVALEGEQVVVIVEPETGPEIQPLSTSTQETTAWYQFWR
jgi:cell division protein FtsB